MKKLVITFLALAGIITGVKAQEAAETDSLALLRSELDHVNSELARIDAENQRIAQEKKWGEIWGKGRYTMIAYAPSASSTENGFKTDASFGLAVAKGNRYFFNKRPFGGMVKVGLDVRWVEISFTKYKKVDYEFTDGWDDDWSYGDDEDVPGFLDGLSDFGRYDVHLSAFGFGPVVSVAPFAHLNNAARYLRASLYFHYKPTVGVHLVSEDGEMESSFAYCNMMDFGGKIQYRAVALGLEGSWGSGKYKQIVFDDEEESLPKVNRKFSSFRIYVALTF